MACASVFPFSCLTTRAWQIGRARKCARYLLIGTRVGKPSDVSAKTCRILRYLSVFLSSLGWLTKSLLGCERRAIFRVLENLGKSTTQASGGSWACESWASFSDAFTFRSYTLTCFAFFPTDFHVLTAISCDGFLDQKGTGGSACLTRFPLVLTFKRLSPFRRAVTLYQPTAPELLKDYQPIALLAGALWWFSN